MQNTSKDAVLRKDVPFLSQKTKINNYTPLLKKFRIFKH